MNVHMTDVPSKKVRIEMEETDGITIFTFVVTNLKDGSYMIADVGSDIEYQRIEVEELEQGLIANELKELLLHSNYSQGTISSEQIHEIAEILANVDL